MPTPRKGPRVMLPEMFEEVMQDVAAGEALRRILTSRGISKDVFYLHVARDTKAREQYAAAKLVGIDRLADELIEIGDDQSREPDDRRVSCDQRKWVMAKLAPKRYGDLVHLQHSGTIDYAGELGRVNTNDHVHETLRAWKSTKRSTA